MRMKLFVSLGVLTVCCLMGCSSRWGSINIPLGLPALTGPNVDPEQSRLTLVVYDYFARKMARPYSKVFFVPYEDGDYEFIHSELPGWDFRPFSRAESAMSKGYRDKVTKESGAILGVSHIVVEGERARASAWHNDGAFGSYEVRLSKDPEWRVIDTSVSAVE